MKSLKSLIYVITTFILISSCIRDFDAPLLEPPVYTGTANITIKDLKARYAEITTPTLIETEFIVKAYVSGNDASGNIYKQLYIQDETGAINLGIDQNSIAATHRVGQEIFLNLHQLYMVKYGGELQIGYDATNANRIPWEIYKTHVNFNGHPSAEKVIPQLAEIGKFTDDMVNTLVQLNDVYFVNGGKTTFAEEDGSTDRIVKNADGSTISVRTSSFSVFAKDTLPEGSGTLVGILGRYNGGWQFILRGREDIINFGNPLPGDLEGLIMNETFGDGYYPSGNRPKINEFKDFQAPPPISYSDRSGNTDIRSMSGDNGAHAWFPAGKDAYLTISNINTVGYSNLEFSFEIAANLYNPSDAIDLNVMTVTCNGNPLTIPSTPVSNANGDNSKFYTFKFDNIPAEPNVIIEFYTNSDKNTLGLRLDNIKLTSKTDNITPTVN